VHPQRYGTDEDDIVFNAVKHCVWQCILSSDPYCRQDYAKAIGDAHEVKSSKERPMEAKMDLHNNEEGRKCGQLLSIFESVKLGDCYRCCERKLISGELWWFRAISNPDRLTELAKELLKRNPILTQPKYPPEIWE
jgi:hypothetical protein